MKYFLLSLVLICNFAKAQVTWTHNEVFTSKSTTSNGVDVMIHKIVFSADIDKGWHIYSEQQDSNFIGIATKIELDTTCEISGISEKGNIEHHYIEQLGLSWWQFTDKVVYTIWFFSKSKEITVKITYQSCNDVECLPAITNEYKLQLP